MSIQRILVVDGDPVSRKYLVEAVSELGYLPVEAADLGEAVEKTREASPDLVIADARGSGPEGTEFFRNLKARYPEIPAVAVAQDGAAEPAIQAVRSGAVDVLQKPWTPDGIELVIDRIERLGRLVRENQYLRQEVVGGAPPDMVAKSTVMLQALRNASRMARSKGTVLITGEPGTGKKRLALHIHQGSSRNVGPFIRLKCAEFPGQTLESELFGREQGAFVGAHRMRTGRFELADGGTLLLDDVASVSLEMQEKVLRVIDDQEIRRVGGTRPVSVDVRVIVTASRDLASLVNEGRFRADLWQRLQALTVHLPPLRERREDVASLAQHFAERFARQRGQTCPRFTAVAVERMTGWSWPGNVCELESAVERAVVSLRRATIDAPDLGLGPISQTSEPRALVSAADAQVPTAALGPSLANRPMEEIERIAILATLLATGGNKTEAARRLGLTARTLSNKMKIWRAAGLVA